MGFRPTIVWIGSDATEEYGLTPLAENQIRQLRYTGPTPFLTDADQERKDSLGYMPHRIAISKEFHIGFTIEIAPRTRPTAILNNYSRGERDIIAAFEAEVESSNLSGSTS